jgi:site-specific DNA recombinase
MSDNTFSQNGHKRAVLYARVSGDDRGKDGRNLKSQLDMGREYAQGRGYTVVAELHEDDRGASGASWELPQLSNVLAMAERREYDVLVVREIDRLSRNLAKQLIVEEELRRAGVVIEYVIGEYPDTPEGNLMKNVKGSVAEYEREKIKERMTRGRRIVVKSGRVMVGDKPPYGYRTIKEQHNGKNVVVGLEVYEEQARIIRTMFDWYTEGMGYGTIAHHLTDMGISTWLDSRPENTLKKRGYGEWATATIAYILKNQTYAGKWHYGKHGGENLIEVTVPAIVSEAQWQHVQDLMREHTQRSKRNTKHEYLMQYRLTCGCNYVMQARMVGRIGKKYPYYRCPSGSGSAIVAHPHCELPLFRADFVDALVWDWLKEWFQDPADLRHKLEAYKAEQDKNNAPILALLKTDDDLIADNQTQLDRLLDLYLSGTFDKDVLTERKARLETTIAKLEHERGELAKRLGHRPSDDEIEDLMTFAYGVAAGLEKADKDFAKRRKIIEVLNVRGIVTIENGERICTVSFILAQGEQGKRLTVPTGRSVGSCVKQSECCFVV